MLGKWLRERGRAEQQATSLHAVEVVDLIRSSSPAPMVDSGDDIEAEVREARIERSLQLILVIQIDDMVEKALGRADKLEKAAKILREQAGHRNPIWMRSVTSRDIRRDADDLVSDILQYVKTARKRDNTWAKGNDKAGRRRMQNTMGYQIPIRNDGSQAAQIDAEGGGDNGLTL